MRSHVDFIFSSFLMGFCSQLRPPEPHGSRPRCSARTIYQPLAFRNLYRCFIDFGANMPPFSLQKSTNIASIIDLGRRHFFDRFLHRSFIDFCSILEANSAPCWPLFLSEWVSAVACSLLFCWAFDLFRFFGRTGLLAPFRFDFGVSGLDFGRFWRPFSSHFSNFRTSIFQQP